MTDFQKFSGLPLRDLARFFSKVEIAGDGDCWNWTGRVTDHGHGQAKFAGKSVYSHRVAFQIFAAESLPDSVVVRHKCDNPRCCNPMHLESGTHADNVADRVTRKRSATGERNGRAKLTPDQVRAIYLDTRKHGAIADHFGVNRTTVVHIKAGKIWRDVTSGISEAP